jgi:hypothetical protein
MLDFASLTLCPEFSQNLCRMLAKHSALEGPGAEIPRPLFQRQLREEADRPCHPEAEAQRDAIGISQEVQGS